MRAAPPIAVVLGLGLSLGVPSPAAGPRAGADPWPMLGGGPAHVGVADGPAPPYRIAWRSQVDHEPQGGPVAGAGEVVVLTRRSVVALDPATGEERWEADREPGPAGSAALAGDLVLHVDGRDAGTALVARDREDGVEAWRADLGSSSQGGVAVAEDVVYVGTRGGEVRAFALEDGAPVWEAEVGGRVDGVPAAAEGLVVVTTQDLDERRGRVVALDAETGEERWDLAPDGNLIGFSSPTIVGETVFVGTGDLRLRALGVEAGSERWSTVLRSPFSPAVAPAVPGAVAIADAIGHLSLLDAESGGERWVFRVPGFMTSGPMAAVGEALVVGDDAGQASAIELGTGHLVWKRTFGEEPVGPPAVTPERIFLAPRAGPVVALEHDPAGTLLDEPSPTTLFLGRALGTYAVAFGIVLAAVLGVFRLGPRLVRREGADGP